MASKSNIWAFINLLMVYPELRSVFYWRLGKLAKFIFFWMPGRTNLYLCTNPKNVEGGFYVGHGWGTVVNAKKMITHRFSLDDVQKGFDTVLDKEHTGALKVVINP